MGLVNGEGDEEEHNNHDHDHDHGRSRGTMSDGIVGAIAISLFGIDAEYLCAFVRENDFHLQKPRSRQREETSGQHGCRLHDTWQRRRCLQNVRPVFLQGWCSLSPRYFIHFSFSFFSFLLAPFCRDKNIKYLPTLISYLTLSRFFSSLAEIVFYNPFTNVFGQVL